MPMRELEEKLQNERFIRVNNSCLYVLFAFVCIIAQLEFYYDVVTLWYKKKRNWAPVLGLCAGAAGAVAVSGLFLRGGTEAAAHIVMPLGMILLGKTMLRLKMEQFLMFSGFYICCMLTVVSVVENWEIWLFGSCSLIFWILLRYDFDEGRFHSRERDLCMEQARNEVLEQSLTEKNARYYRTGSSLLDVVINTKYHVARQKGVAFIVSVNLQKQEAAGLQFMEKHLAVILGNLYDNAIEAAESCEKGYVSLAVWLSG